MIRGNYLLNTGYRAEKLPNEHDLFSQCCSQCRKVILGWTSCLGHRRNFSCLCLLYEIYHRANHPLHANLNHFVAAHNTRASAALWELALVIPLCSTDKISRSCLPVAVRLWNLLPSDLFSSSTLSSFKSAINLCLQRELLDFLFRSLFACL